MGAGSSGSRLGRHTRTGAVTVPGMTTWDDVVAAYERGLTEGHSRGFTAGWQEGAERGYGDGLVQGRHDVRSGYARTHAARDALAALAAFDEAWDRRRSPEALRRAALVAPGCRVDLSDAARDRERLGVVLRALDIAAHVETVRVVRAVAS